MSFAKYAALVKNLRGVVLGGLSDEGTWSSIQWLVKRFRYRNLGVTPSMAKRYRDRLGRYLNGNPFVELVPPVNPVAEFVEMLSSSTTMSVEVAELLAYASAYVSPAIVVGERYADELAKVAVDVVYVCKDMDVSLWRLHLRIADYTVLDFYGQCIDEVLKALSDQLGGGAEVLKSIASDRRSRIAKDKRRYWRIACSSGTRFLLYVDMVSVVLSHGLEGLLKPDHAACLAVVPVVVIPPGLR